MSTGYVGLDVHNPHGTQNPDGRYWGRMVRRETASGCIVQHTAEIPPDQALPDYGAENTASYQTRSDRAGSYHRVTDSDSIVRFLPFTHEAYGVGTFHTNWHAIHVSGATQAHIWGLNPTYDDAVLRNMALANAEGLHFALGAGAGRGVRRISLEQAVARQPGLINHGTLDPSRRSDAWVNNPHNPFLWETILDYTGDAVRGVLQPGHVVISPEEWAAIANYVRFIALEVA